MKIKCTNVRIEEAILNLLSQVNKCKQYVTNNTFTILTKHSLINMALIVQKMFFNFFLLFFVYVENIALISQHTGFSDYTIVSTFSLNPNFILGIGIP